MLTIIHVDYFDFAVKKVLLVVYSYSKWIKVLLFRGTTVNENIQRFCNMFDYVDFSDTIIAYNDPLLPVGNLSNCVSNMEFNI